MTACCGFWILIFKGFQRVDCTLAFECVGYISRATAARLAGTGKSRHRGNHGPGVGGLTGETARVKKILQRGIGNTGRCLTLLVHCILQDIACSARYKTDIYVAHRVIYNKTEADYHSQNA